MMMFNLLKFCGNPIHFSPGDFVPGEQTAWWTEKVAQEIRKENTPVRVLDIFSGSGCVGIALLKRCPKQIKHLDFAEKYKSVCKKIFINCETNSIIHEKYTILQSDIFGNIRGKYDYICAVPPYAAKSKMRFIKESVLRSQPRSSMFGGSDGLLYIRKFLKQALDYLEKGGVIYLEHDPSLQPAVEKIITANKYSNHVFHLDLFGRYGWVEIHN